MRRVFSGEFYEVYFLIKTWRPGEDTVGNICPARGVATPPILRTWPDYYVKWKVGQTHIRKKGKMIHLVRRHLGAVCRPWMGPKLSHLNTALKFRFMELFRAILESDPCSCSGQRWSGTHLIIEHVLWGGTSLGWLHWDVRWPVLILVATALWYISMYLTQLSCLNCSLKAQRFGTGRLIHTNPNTYQGHHSNYKIHFPHQASMKIGSYLKKTTLPRVRRCCRLGNWARMILSSNNSFLPVVPA